MKKKHFLLLIAVFMLSLLMVACGGEQAEPVTDDQDTTAEEPAETDDAKADATEDEEESSTPRNVVVHGDTINSSQVEHAVCIVNSRFEQGWRMVFRATVTDPETKELIEDADVKVVLGNGEEFEMELGEHGENKTLLYAVGWTIPEDFPTGTLDYEIIATVDGVDYAYEPFDVAPSKLTIIEPTEEG